jgi:hypothetical protein
VRTGRPGIRAFGATLTQSQWPLALVVDWILGTRWAAPAALNLSGLFVNDLSGFFVNGLASPTGGALRVPR